MNKTSIFGVFVIWSKNEQELKNMKKTLIIISSIFLLFLVGCGCNLDLESKKIRLELTCKDTCEKYNESYYRSTIPLLDSNYCSCLNYYNEITTHHNIVINENLNHSYHLKCEENEIIRIK